MSELVGQIEPCQCRRRNLATLAEQVGLVTDARKAGGARPFLTLYAGNTLPAELATAGLDQDLAEQWTRLRQNTLVSAVAVAQPDGIVPGEGDFGREGERLAVLVKKFRGKVVCSNAKAAVNKGLASELRGTVGSTEWRLRGVVIPGERTPSGGGNEIFGDAVDALGMRERTGAKSSKVVEILVVCYSPMSDPMAIDRVVRECGRGSVVVLAGVPAAPTMLVDVERTAVDLGVPLLRAEPRGQEWLIASVSYLEEGAPWGSTSRLGALRRLRGALKEAEAKSGVATSAAIPATLTSRLVDEEARVQRCNVLDAHSAGIVIGTPTNPLVAEQLARYRSEMKVLFAGQRTARDPTLGASYRGWRTCGECHAEVVKGWSESRHAHAWQSLVKARRESDIACVMCHVTGFMEAGGFRSHQDAERLGDVQCEVCHGPAREHPKAGGPLAAVRRETCVRCHDPLNSPHFDFAEYLRRVSCKKWAGK